MTEFDVRLEMRLKNNALYQAMFPRWSSVRSFVLEARAAGFTVGLASTYNLLTFRGQPRRQAKGGWTTTAQSIADFLKMLPEDLFPEGLYERIKEPTRVIELDSSRELPNSERVLRGLPAPSDKTTMGEVESHDQSATIQSVLATLTEKEREVIRARFGLPGAKTKGSTLEEIARNVGTTRARVRQIEAKAIRKLQHPERVVRLEEFVAPDPGRGRELVDAKKKAESEERAAREAEWRRTHEWDHESKSYRKVIA